MNKRQAKKQEKTQNRVPSQTTHWLNTINNNKSNNNSNSLTNAENAKLKHKLDKEKHKDLKYKNWIKNQLTKKNKTKNSNSSSNKDAEIIRLKKEIQKERNKRKASLAKEKQEKQKEQKKARIKKQKKAKAKKQWQEKFKKISTLQWNCAIQLGTLTQIVGLETILGYDSRTKVIQKLLDISQDTILKEYQAKHKDTNAKSKFIDAMHDFLHKRRYAIKNHEDRREKVREINKKNRKKSKASSK